jgi:7-cyano-7-deazaguanine synthase
LLNVDYGQRAAVAEWRATQAFANHYHLSAQQIQLPWLGSLKGSALTDPRMKMPVFERYELDEQTKTKQSAKVVWVPNRNGVLLHVAATFAEAHGVSKVWVGFNREEAATFPDNSADYLKAINLALEYSTQNKVKVESFTLHWDKSEIVRNLRALPDFPWNLIWSCYLDGQKPCGVCESCQRLKRALEQ